MLNMNSFSRSSTSAEKSVQVKILTPIYVAGEAREVGSTATMSLSDAQALQNSTPPAVAILT